MSCANPFRPMERKNVKDVIEEMRQEINAEREEEGLNALREKPNKPKKPSHPYTKRPTKPKRKAQRFKKGKK